MPTKEDAMRRAQAAQAKTLLDVNGLYMSQSTGLYQDILGQNQMTNLMGQAGTAVYATPRGSAKDLLGVNVNGFTEKKNGLTYLSWAHAWAEVLKQDPHANFNIKLFDGSPLMLVGNSYMVWVDVTIFGKTMTGFLPVLDFRNKPITSPTSFDVNTSIMRCLAKGVALHGLGLYIYAGEDLPMDAQKEEEVPVVVDGKVYRDQETEWDNSDASRTLFAEGIINYADLCKTVAGLNSYWLNNQLQLESLKSTHPALYQEVLNHFKKVKENLSKSAADAAPTEPTKE